MRHTRVIVIEDEPLSARRLVELLAKVAPHIEVLAQLASAEETVRWLSEHAPPELIFADVQLQDGQVFDAFRQLHSVAPVIFTTAYDRFLLDAFRAQGIAYLLKPFGEAELAAALTKYETLRHGLGRFDGAELDGLIRQLAAEPAAHRRHFTVKSGRRIRVLPLDRVALIVHGNAGVEFIDTNGKCHFPSSHISLTEIERSLPPTRFFRVSRTEIVALDAIDHVEPSGDRVRVALKGTDRVSIVSVHRVAAFRKWLGVT